MSESRFLEYTATRPGSDSASFADCDAHDPRLKGDLLLSLSRVRL